MEKQTQLFYIAQVANLAKHYTNTISPLGINVFVGNSKEKNVITKGNNQVKIIFDPLYQTQNQTEDNVYVCYSEIDLAQMIDYMIEHPELFTDMADHDYNDAQLESDPGLYEYRLNNLDN